MAQRVGRHGQTGEGYMCGWVSVWGGGAGCLVSYIDVYGASLHTRTPRQHAAPRRTQRAHPTAPSPAWGCAPTGTRPSPGPPPRGRLVRSTPRPGRGRLWPRALTLGRRRRRLRRRRPTWGGWWGGGDWSGEGCRRRHRRRRCCGGAVFVVCFGGLKGGVDWWVGWVNVSSGVMHAYVTLM